MPEEEEENLSFLMQLSPSFATGRHRRPATTVSAAGPLGFVQTSGNHGGTHNLERTESGKDCGDQSPCPTDEIPHCTGNNDE
jgi:hypothetical protein